MASTVTEAGEKVSRQVLDAEKRKAAAAVPPAQKGQNGKPKVPTMSEAERRQRMQQMQAQQEYNFRRQLDIRKVEALEAIAEALHVAGENEILAWRKVQEEKQVALAKEQERLKAEAIAKANPVEGSPGIHKPNTAHALDCKDPDCNGVGHCTTAEPVEVDGLHLVPAGEVTPRS